MNTIKTNDEGSAQTPKQISLSAEFESEREPIETIPVKYRIYGHPRIHDVRKLSDKELAERFLNSAELTVSIYDGGEKIQFFPGTGKGSTTTLLREIIRRGKAAKKGGKS